MSGGSTAISVIAKQMGISSAYDCSAMVSLPSETTLHKHDYLLGKVLFVYDLTLVRADIVLCVTYIIPNIHRKQREQRKARQHMQREVLALLDNKQLFA